MNNKYSVLMSVYHRETPERFRESIESVLRQTVPPADFVIVCDGELTSGLNRVIFEYTERCPGLFQIVRLRENRGVGAAANEGLKYCKNELVAKMDSDDLSLPERCGKLLVLFAEDSGLIIAGGQLGEFSGSPDNIISVRRVPLEHGDILKYARRRMPFNHVTVMYKKSAVIAAGGYALLRRAEDYDLAVRLLQGGAKARNLPEILAVYRQDEDAFKRQTAGSTLRDFVSVHWRIYRYGFCGFFDFLIPSLAKVFWAILPKGIRGFMYKKILRRPANRRTHSLRVPRD